MACCKYMKIFQEESMWLGETNHWWYCEQSTTLGTLYLRSTCKVMVKSVDSAVSLPEFKSQLHHSVTGNSGQVINLCFSFLVHKMKTVKAISKGCWED